VVIGNLHHSVQQELVAEETERMGHKIRNLWNIRHTVNGSSLSLFFRDIESSYSNSEIYDNETYTTRESKLSLLTRSKIIYHNARYTELSSIPRGTAHTDQDA
jgi:hypothetical protein